MIHNVFTIARFTLYEAIRSRLFYMVIIGVVCVFGLTVFIGELAITETKVIQVLLMASVLRFFTVITVALFVITSMVREFNDKGFELILSLPLPRSSYYFGKFLGFVFLSLTIALLSSLLLLVHGETMSVLVWFFSLVCELLIIISLGLLCLFTFNNITIAFIAVLSFYLLSRAMYTIQLISASPILEYKTFSQEFINYVVDAIAFVLPGMHLYTKSEWLAYGVDVSELVPIVVQTIIYLLILCAAGLFDLYRKDL